VSDGWEIGTVRCTSVIVNGNKVLGDRSGAIAAPQGGSVVDAEARASLNAVLAALRQHGLISS